MMYRIIYLPEYFQGMIGNELNKETEPDILYWNFENKLDDAIKRQIELLLNQIVRIFKNRRNERNRYLRSLKYLFCYAEISVLRDISKMERAQEQEYAAYIKQRKDIDCISPAKFITFCRKELFLFEKETNWDANIWYVEGMSFAPERYSRSTVIDSFSFMEIQNPENRRILQNYMKYLCTVTQLNLGTIRIKHMITREFLKYLEEKREVVSQIDTYVLNRYFAELSGRNIKAQSYNNKLREILIFLQYLYVTDNIKQLNISISFYQMKNYTAVNEIRNLGEKLDMLMAHLVEFPEQLRIMCMVLLFTGIDKGKMFSLKNADFYFENDNSWMRVPDTSRKIPVPDILHYLVMQYAKKNGIGVEKMLFLNNGKRFTAERFLSE